MIIGIIGLGSIGIVHAKNLLAMGHTITCFDPDPNAGASMDWMTQPLTEPMDLWPCQAVVISSPTDFHAQGASLAVGKPMLIEKPIADSLSVMQMVAERTPIMMTASNMRYHPVVKVVKERMYELGGPYHSAWFRLHQEKKNAKDPVILNWGAHEVDLALYLLDKKLEVWKESCKVSHDLAEFILRYSGGPLVHMELSYSGPSDRCFAIHGPDASIHADLDNFTVHIFSRQGREIIAVEGSHEQTYMDEMKEFIRRVEGKPSDGIGATGEDGLRCLKVLLEARK